LIVDIVDKEICELVNYINYFNLLTLYFTLSIRFVKRSPLLQFYTVLWNEFWSTLK